MKKLVIDRAYLDAHSVDDPSGGCRVWTGLRNWKGYGRIAQWKKSTPAHRASYELAHGAVPEGLFVLHRCDNRACINPEHLFVGTQSENMQDMVSKGRSIRGEAHCQAKLTSEQVLKIRKDERRSDDVAADYGVSRALVTRIRKRIAWGWLEA